MDSSYIWEFHPSITNDGTLYFCWWENTSLSGNIYMAKPGKNGYSEIIKLEAPVNTKHLDCDPYVAPDESYLIFKSNRPGGYGKMDLYISYRKQDGNWTEPINLGPNINTPRYDDVGDISPDGKYMFFTRKKNIYWVSAGFIDSLKHVMSK